LRKDLRGKTSEPALKLPAFDTRTHYSNTRQLTLPVKWLPNAAGKKAVLFESSDKGQGWTMIGQIPSTRNSFFSKVSCDGTFHYSLFVPTEGQSVPKTMTDLQPLLTVVVDTQPPVIEATFAGLGTNQVEARWRIRDANPDLSTLRLEYRLTGSKEWTHYKVPA